MLAVFLVLILLFSFLFGKSIVIWVYHHLKDIVQERTFKSRLIIMLTQVPFNAVLFLGGLFYFNMMLCLLMKNFLESWLLLTTANYLSSMAVYYVINNFFQDAIHKRFEHYLPYIVFIEETKVHPLRDGIIMNFLFIPPNIKNYLMGASSLNTWQAAIAFLPNQVITIGMFCMVGSQLTSIHDIFVKKSLKDLSSSEIIALAVSIFFIIMTVAVFAIIGLYFHKKFKDYSSLREVDKALSQVYNQSLENELQSSGIEAISKKENKL